MNLSPKNHADDSTGGAYASPADAGHYLVLQWLVDEAAKENKSLAFAVLHYGECAR